MRLNTLLLTGWMAAPIAAQAQTFILPPRTSDRLGTSTTTDPGGAMDLDLFSANGVQPVRVQYLWPVAEVPVPTALLTGLALRRNNNWRATLPAATATVALDLSVGPNAPRSRSATFASNRGAFVFNVFNGTLDLPAAAASPGVAPFVVMLPFTQPFPYLASLGRSLVAEFNVTSYNPTTPGTWAIDAVGPDSGRYAQNLGVTTCLFTNGAFADYGFLVPLPELGQPFALSLAGRWTMPIPSRLPVVGLLGFQGRNSTWNGIPLPFDLGSLGAPGCSLATSIAITVPVTETVPGIYEWPTFTIPTDPTLYDGSFYDQTVFAEPGANALGLVFSNSMKFTVRSGDLPTGGRVYQVTINGAPWPNATDGWLSDEVAVAQFSY